MKTDPKYTDQAKLIVGQQAVTNDENPERCKGNSGGSRPTEKERKTHHDEANYVVGKTVGGLGMKRMIISSCFGYRINPTTARRFLW
jgi:hypothetical protein